MWQEHGMKFQEFFSLSPEEQAAYIASELYVREKKLEALEKSKQ